MKVFKGGKASGVDGNINGVLQAKSEYVLECLWKICKIPWEKGKMSDDWVKAAFYFFK